MYIARYYLLNLVVLRATDVIMISGDVATTIESIITGSWMETSKKKRERIKKSCWWQNVFSPFPPLRRCFVLCGPFSLVWSIHMWCWYGGWWLLFCIVFGTLAQNILFFIVVKKRRTDWLTQDIDWMNVATWDEQYYKCGIKCTYAHSHFYCSQLA